MHLLIEMATAEIYHFTGLRNLWGIIEDDAFKTSTVLGSGSDEHHNKGKFFFFSTQRSGHGKIGYARTARARIVMDGHKLNQKYKVKPVNYWMQSRQPAGIPDQTDSIISNMMMGDEMEDRVMLNASEIPNASTYIRRIDVLFDPSNERDTTSVQMIHRASEGKFEIHYFTMDQRSDWDNMRIEKASVTPADIEEFETDEEYRTKSRQHKEYSNVYGYRDLILYLILMDSDRVEEAKGLMVSDIQFQENYELYYKSKAPTAKKFLEKLIENELDRSNLGRIAYPIMQHELITSLKNIFHNERSTDNRNMRKLIQIFTEEMRKRGLKNVKDVIEYVQPKAKELYDQ